MLGVLSADDSEIKLHQRVVMQPLPQMNTAGPVSPPRQLAFFA
jgi:hypothetical protein